MKKLLIIPLLLMAFASYAQLPVIRAPDGVTVEDYRAYFLKNFRLPVFHDTTEANVAKGLDSVGTMIAIRGTDTVYIRRTSTGTIHKWSQLVGSGGGGVTDTIYVTPIGTAAGMIQTLYAVDGNLRVSNWGPGYGTTTHLAGDSLAYIDIDTTSIAYKAWVISLFGTSINNLQQVIDNGNRLTSDDVINSAGHRLTIDSVKNPTFALAMDGGNPSRFTLVDTTKDVWLQIGQSTTSSGLWKQGMQFDVGGIRSGGLSGFAVPYFSLIADSGRVTYTDQFSNNFSMASSTFGNPGITFSPAGGHFTITGLPTSNDSAAYKPVGYNSVTQELALIDHWAGSGGGGSSSGVGRDTVQAYTSGTTLTQSASTNYIQVNPASVQATLTITTLASGGTWHTSNDLYIVFGGTVTSGNPVITSFTLTAGSGLTLVQSVAPSGIINAGEVVHLHKVGNFLYRIN